MAKRQSRSLADTSDDDLAKFAGDEAEDDLKMMNTRVPAKLLRQLKIYTVTNETTIREFVTAAIIEKFESLGERVQ